MDDKGNYIMMDEYVTGAVIGGVCMVQYEELSPICQLTPKYIDGYQQSLTKVMDITDIDTEDGWIYIEISIESPGL